MDTDRELLAIRNMTVRFGGLVAVNDVSLLVEKGKIAGLIGPNGAGKTTLLNLVSGFFRPTKGQLIFRGRDITRFSASHRAGLGIGRTFQQPQLFNEMSVLENVALGEYTKGSSGLFTSGLVSTFWRKLRKLRESSTALLQLVGLEGLSEHRAGDLSFGQKKILEIARAMACQPQLLLLDEPAAGLNQQEVGLVNNIIQKIQRLGVTVFLIEHNMQMVMNICQNLSVLDFGRLIAHGLPEEVRANPKVQEAYLGKKYQLQQEARKC